jgi:ribonuclease HI
VTGSDRASPSARNEVKLFLRTDGASRGNPGPAAIGVSLSNSRGQIVQEFGRTLGVTTNNEAEYRGLLAGLDAALAQGATELEISLDSELLVAQVNGHYKVRAGNLRPLHAEAKRKLKRFQRVRIVQVPRSSNSRADELANRALDQARS